MSSRAEKCCAACGVANNFSLIKLSSVRTSFIKSLNTDRSELKVTSFGDRQWQKELALHRDNEDRGSLNEKTMTDRLAHKIEEELLHKTLKSVPVERINIQIEVRKLKKLLAETVNILTFAMCIPQLCENDFYLLQNILLEPEVLTVRNLLGSINFKTCSLFGAAEYEFRRTNFFTESSASDVEKFYSEYRDEKNLACKKEIEDVWTAIDFLFQRVETHPRLFTDDLKSKIPEHSKEMIDSLDKLFNHILREMEKSPKEAEEQEIELSRMFMAFEQLSNEMITLHSGLRPAIEDNLLKIMDACNEVQSLKDQRKKLKSFLVSSHQRIRNNLEKNTMLYNLDAIKTTKEKMGPRKELIAKHQKLVKEDLAEEKSLRVKKYKIEQVLQGVINKYEQDMDDRNKTLAHLNDMYDKEMNQMKQMQERFNAQEKVYNILMEEKAKYEQFVWEQKLREIRRKMAARKIQRFYRGYLSFMQAHGRKKGKGRGKGKKR